MENIMLNFKNGFQSNQRVEIQSFESATRIWFGFGSRFDCTISKPQEGIVS